MAITTPTVTGFLDHTTDAAFRAWVTDYLNTILNNSWSLGGTIFPNIALSSDTGQMTTTTLASATRPGANTKLATNGYVIIHSNDTMASSAPWAMRLDFGTNAGGTSGSVWITIGTGSNGSGTITGQWQASTQMGGLVDQTSTTTNRNSTACCVDGAINMSFKRQHGSAGTSTWWSLCRTLDSSGVPDARGLIFHYTAGVGPNTAILCTSYAVTGGSTTTMGLTSCLVPGGITNTAIAGNFQVFKYYHAVNGSGIEVDPVFGLIAVSKTEYSHNATPTAKVLGTTSHAYLVNDCGTSQQVTANANSNYSIALLAE